MLFSFFVGSQIKSCGSFVWQGRDSMKDRAQRRQDYMPKRFSFFFSPPHKNNLSIALKSRYWLALRLFERFHLFFFLDTSLWAPINKNNTPELSKACPQLDPRQKYTLFFLFFLPDIWSNTFGEVQLLTQRVENHMLDSKCWRGTDVLCNFIPVVEMASSRSRCEAAEWQLSVPGSSNAHTHTHLCVETVKLIHFHIALLDLIKIILKFWIHFNLSGGEHKNSCA